MKRRFIPALALLVVAGVDVAYATGFSNQSACYGVAVHDAWTFPVFSEAPPCSLAERIDQIRALELQTQ